MFDPDHHLEERILQAVESETQSSSKNFFQHDPAKCRRLWLVPPAIAVGVLFTIGSDSLRSNPFFRTTWATTTLNEAELVRLEAFLEHNWDSVTTSRTREIDLQFTESELVQLANYKPKKISKSTEQKTARR